MQSFFTEFSMQSYLGHLNLPAQDTDFPVWNERALLLRNFFSIQISDALCNLIVILLSSVTFHIVIFVNFVSFF